MIVRLVGLTSTTSIELGLGLVVDVEVLVTAATAVLLADAAGTRVPRPLTTTLVVLRRLNIGDAGRST